MAILEIGLLVVLVKACWGWGGEERRGALCTGIVDFEGLLYIYYTFTETLLPPSPIL